jgi:CheY-like chemotaxis protein
MSVSILVDDDEPDVADLFRQRFRRETRQGTYVMHFTASGAEALDRLAGAIAPALVAVLSDIENASNSTADRHLVEFCRNHRSPIVLWCVHYAN